MANHSVQKFSRISENLGSESFDASSFKYYPNPAENILNLSYDEEISEITFFNLLGQKVLSKTIKEHKPQIDISNLPSGSCLMRATSDGNSKTFKIIET